MSFRARFSSKFRRSEGFLESDGGRRVTGYYEHETLPSFRDERGVYEREVDLGFHHSGYERELVGSDSRFPRSPQPRGGRVSYIDDNWNASLGVYDPRSREELFTGGLRGELPEERKVLVVNDLKDPYLDHPRTPLNYESKEVLDDYERLHGIRSRSPLIIRSFDQDNFKSSYNQSLKRKSRSRSFERDDIHNIRNKRRRPRQFSSDHQKSFKRSIPPSQQKDYMLKESEREKSLEKLSLSSIERQIEYEKKRQQMLMDQQKTLEKRSVGSDEKLLKDSKTSFETNKGKLPISRLFDRKEDLPSKNVGNKRSNTPVSQTRRFKGDHIIIERGRSYERSESPQKKEREKSKEFVNDKDRSHRSREKNKGFINDKDKSINRPTVVHGKSRERRSQSPGGRYRSRKGSKEFVNDTDRNRERKSNSPGKRLKSRENSKEFVSDRDTSLKAVTSNIRNRNKKDDAHDKTKSKSFDRKSEKFGLPPISQTRAENKGLSVVREENRLQLSSRPGRKFDKRNFNEKLHEKMKGSSVLQTASLANKRVFQDQKRAASTDESMQEFLDELEKACERSKSPSEILQSIGDEKQSLRAHEQSSYKDKNGTNTKSSGQEKLPEVENIDSNSSSALFIQDPFDNRTDKDFGDVTEHVKIDSPAKVKEGTMVNSDGHETAEKEQRFNAYDLLFSEQSQDVEKLEQHMSQVQEQNTEGSKLQSTNDVKSDKSENVPQVSNRPELNEPSDSSGKQSEILKFAQIAENLIPAICNENPELRIIQNLLYQHFKGQSQNVPLSQAATSQSSFEKPNKNLQFNQDPGQFYEEPGYSSLLQTVLKAAPSLGTSIGESHLPSTAISSSQINVQTTKQRKKPQYIDLTKYLGGTFGIDYLAYLDHKADDDDIEANDDDSQEQNNPPFNPAVLNPRIRVKFYNDPPSPEELGYMLKGFVLFFGTRTDGQLVKDPFTAIIDSFSNSGLGNLDIEDFEIFMNGPKQVCLLRWHGMMLARGRGRTRRLAREEAALSLINALARTCYSVQARFHYYNAGRLPNFMLKTRECPGVYKLISREEFIKSITSTLKLLKERGFYVDRGIDATHILHVIDFIDQFFKKRNTHCELFFGGPDPMEFSYGELRDMSKYVSRCPWLQWRKVGGREEGTYLAVSVNFSPQQIYRYLLKNGGKTLRYKLIPPQGPFIDLMQPGGIFSREVINFTPDFHPGIPGFQPDAPFAVRADERSRLL